MGIYRDSGRRRASAFADIGARESERSAGQEVVFPSASPRSPARPGSEPGDIYSLISRRSIPESFAPAGARACSHASDVAFHAERERNFQRPSLRASPSR